MSLQIGFFPKEDVEKERTDLTPVSSAIPKPSVGSKKEMDPELEKLLEIFCKPSAEKTITG